MIHPFTKIAIKGALWYQGEANSGWEPTKYSCLLHEMFAGWRSTWAARSDTSENFPVGIVQLGPLANKLNQTRANNGEFFPLVRWHQSMDFGVLPNSMEENMFMAVSMDTYYQDEVHPRNKQLPGKRLGVAGLAVAYGIPNLPTRGPFPATFHFHAAAHSTKVPEQIELLVFLIPCFILIFPRWTSPRTRPPSSTTPSTTLASSSAVARTLRRTAPATLKFLHPTGPFSPSIRSTTMARRAWCGWMSISLGNMIYCIESKENSPCLKSQHDSVKVSVPLCSGPASLAYLWTETPATTIEGLPIYRWFVLSLHLGGFHVRSPCVRWNPTKLVCPWWDVAEEKWPEPNYLSDDKLLKTFKLFKMRRYQHLCSNSSPPTKYPTLVTPITLISDHPGPQ